MIQTFQTILRVANGKEALDHSPDTPADWRSEIDTEALDMADTDECILGQLGGYVRLVKRLAGIDRDIYPWALAHGFDQDFSMEDSGFDSFTMLQDAWLVVIG